MRGHTLMILLFASATLLSACGGGSNGATGSSSTPPPPPPPPPPPTGGIAPFGVTADTTFASVGDDIDIRWIEASKSYEIRLSESDWTRLTFESSSSAGEHYYPASSSYGLTVSKPSGYQYTALATQFENGWGYPLQAFAFGLPTGTGDVPITGAANYDFTISGRNEGNDWTYLVGGNGQMSFDFAAGTLSGHFEPTINNWTEDTRALGRYDFVNTVYGVGSTTFAGELKHASFLELGQFDGRFNGPQAFELMAQWRAPYINPWTESPGHIVGFWIGKIGD